MFTGIVTALGTVRRIAPLGEGRDMRLTIGTPPAFRSESGRRRGRRIDRLLGLLPDRGRARAGLVRRRRLGGDAVQDHPRRAGAPERPVNLERPLRVGDELGGHLVSGHVDGVGEAAIGCTRTRLDALAISRPRRARPVHRIEGERRGRWRVAHGERGRGRAPSASTSSRTPQSVTRFGIAAAGRSR